MCLNEMVETKNSDSQKRFENQSLVLDFHFEKTMNINTSLLMRVLMSLSFFLSVVLVNVNASEYTPTKCWDISWEEALSTMDGKICAVLQSLVPHTINSILEGCLELGLEQHLALPDKLPFCLEPCKIKSHLLLSQFHTLSTCNVFLQHVARAQKA